MLCRLLVAVLIAGAAAGSAHAQRATERYAPLQLGMAQQALQSARAAMGSDPQRAARFAHQAELDARLTWGMTDSQILRHDAVQIAAESAALLDTLEARAQPQAAAH